MFYSFMRGVVRVVLFIINGNAHYEKKDRIPQNQNYILVAPHRTWWEPLYLAVGGSPKNLVLWLKKSFLKTLSYDLS